MHAAFPPWELPGRWILQNPPKNPFLEKNEGRGVPARCRRPHCTPNKGARRNQGVIRADVSQGPHCREGKLILGAAGNGTGSQRRGGKNNEMPGRQQFPAEARSYKSPSWESNWIKQSCVFIIFFLPLSGQRKAQFVCHRRGELRTMCVWGGMKSVGLGSTVWAMGLLQLWVRQPHSWVPAETSTSEARWANRT